MPSGRAIARSGCGRLPSGERAAAKKATPLAPSAHQSFRTPLKLRRFLWLRGFQLRGFLRQRPHAAAARNGGAPATPSDGLRASRRESRRRRRSSLPARAGPRARTPAACRRRPRASKSRIMTNSRVIGPASFIACSASATRARRAISSRTASPRSRANGSGLSVKRAIAASRLKDSLVASAVNAAMARFSSSSAPPSRWRYCCENSGHCVPTRANRKPIAMAMRLANKQDLPDLPQGQAIPRFRFAGAVDAPPQRAPIRR